MPVQPLTNVLFIAGATAAGNTSDDDEGNAATEGCDDDDALWQANFRLEYVVQPPPAGHADVRGASQQSSELLAVFFHQTLAG